ncbi:hypothetical protein EKL99_03010 [Flavobacterium sp. ZB4P23]|uniref:Uncharacterized protein n=1 Tax=Flavobacterium bomense TaxID=2497483 RepID=A0A432CGD8_9FLAO|nr:MULTISPECIES: hypothetical protein [Flavobacterium]RTY73213.1 hypothetical protein EKL96_12735 [Flavobacterium sp. LS1R10]RTY84966.1 hypothetical protein EKL99_03010 [Flavobacterium sp. ZB4P23]RTY90787.1 hypothetical protein EKM01_10170 [Flavobacterium sp. RSP46]RTZ01978.1 hypothetical protein EKL98_14250 [Flavobacterium bomense]
MKNLILFCLLLACFGFESCKKNQNLNATDAARTQAEKPINVQCYKALFEKDTIDLEISTLQNGKITGNMVMKIFNMPKKTGKINGEFRGDTLFADYSFIQGTYDKITYKNPLAMLKKGNELILGNGKIETYLGASYFVKGVPIDFDNVKYKFISVDCVGEK